MDAELRDPRADRRTSRSPGRPQHPAAERRPLDQRLLRRHGLAGLWPWSAPTAGRDRARPAVRDVDRPRSLAAWSDPKGGGIPWRRGDDFKNTPANGPAAILLARTGHLDRAVATADWIDRRLRDPETGLIWTGARPGRPARPARPRVETTIYSYCQGVVLGAELELAHRVRSPAGSVRRVSRLVRAVAAKLTTDGVLTGHRGATRGCSAGSWPATWRSSPGLPGDGAALPVGPARSRFSICKAHIACRWTSHACPQAQAKDRSETES